MAESKIHLLIRKERERAKLSQEELAIRAKLPARQTVTEIEAGKRDVKAWELAKIADALGIDVHAFFSAVATGKKHGYVLWRQVPVENKEHIENLFLKRCEQYALVEQLIQPGAHKQLPQNPVNVAKASFTQVFDLANEVRRELSLGDQPACALSTVLEEDYAVKIFIASLCDACSAASARGDFGAAILMNGDEPVWRRNYSCAHELFHLITWNESLFDSLNDEANDWLRKRNEQLADLFAAGLLMPGDQLKADLHKLVENNKIKHADLISLASKYGVSTIALLWRLHNIGCIDKDVVDKLQGDSSFKQLDREYRAQHKDEEKLPARFVRLIFQAVSHGKLSRANAADMLGVSLIDLPDAFEAAGFVESADGDIKVSAA